MGLYFDQKTQTMKVRYTSCKFHPKYTGKKPPRGTCPVCWIVYFGKEQ